MSVKPLKCFLLGQGFTLPFGHLGSRWPWLMKESDSVNKRTCVQSVLGLRETRPKLQVRELALCASKFYWCNSKYAWEKSLVLFCLCCLTGNKLGITLPALLCITCGHPVEGLPKQPVSLSQNLGHRRNLPIYAPPPRLLNTTALPNSGLP